MYEFDETSKQHLNRESLDCDIVNNKYIETSLAYRF